MSKTDFAIVEVITVGFDRLKEIAIICVDASTLNKTGVSYIQINQDDNEYSQSLEEAMDTLVKMLNNKKLASHTGLDFESNYLNKTLKETHGFDNVIKRSNVIDTHVLAMKFLKRVRKDIESIAKFFNIAYNDDRNALVKANTSYEIIRTLFVKPEIRQHTYKYSPEPVVFPETNKEPKLIKRIITTVEETIYEVN